MNAIVFFILSFVYVFSIHAETPSAFVAAEGTNVLIHQQCYIDDGSGSEPVKDEVHVYPQPNTEDDGESFSLYKWEPEYGSDLRGIAPNTKVLLLLDDGTFKPAKVEGLTCIPGECRENYLGLALDSITDEPVPNSIAASKVAYDKGWKGVIKKTINLDERVCNKIAAKAQKSPVGAFKVPKVDQTLPPEERTTYKILKPECQRITFDKNEVTLVHLGLETHSPEKTSSEYKTLIRVSVPDTGKPSRFIHSPWTSQKELGSHGDNIYADKNVPSGIIKTDQPGTYRLIWWRSEGIIGPALISIIELIVDGKAKLQWSSYYSAGGQPCD